MFLVVLGVSAWLNNERIKKHIDDTRLERVQLLSEIVTNGLKSIMLEGKPKEEFQRFLDTIAAEDIHAVRIFSEDGIILSSTVPGELGSFVDARTLNAYKSYKGTSLLTRDVKGQRIYSSIVVMNNDWLCQRCHGTDEKIRAIVNLDITMEKVDKDERQADFWSLILYFCFVGILSLATTYYFKKHVIRPISGLKTDIKSIADGNLALRAPLYEEDELRDISEEVNRLAGALEKAEEEIYAYASRETGQMEKMASIGELAATVAHEIKNPLAGISGAIQVIAEDIPDNSPRKEICFEILSEIERLDRAVKELIAYAKPHEINPAFSDINEIIRKATYAVKPDAETLGIIIEFLPGVLPFASVDNEQLEKVMISVIQYQMQLMPDGGTVTVSSEYNEPSKEICITFADTALAMSEDKIKGIFRPSFSTKHIGTGLGLAVGRNIIEAHGGRIKVNAEPGIGNFFHIIMPVRGESGTA